MSGIFPSWHQVGDQQSAVGLGLRDLKKIEGKKVIIIIIIKKKS